MKQSQRNAEAVVWAFGRGDAYKLFLAADEL